LKTVQFPPRQIVKNMSISTATVLLTGSQPTVCQGAVVRNFTRRCWQHWWLAEQYVVKILVNKLAKALESLHRRALRII